MSDHKNYDNICWSNGSKLVTSSGAAPKTAHGTWKGPGGVCMEGDAVSLETAPRFTLWRAGATLVLDEKTGQVICPDGSTANIGTNYGGCGYLRALFKPDAERCIEGTCM